MPDDDDPAASASDRLGGLLAPESEMLRAAGLAADEADLIAAKRRSLSDPVVRQLARERFAGLWDEPEPAPTEADERGSERRGFWVMAAFAVAAAVAVRLPEAFGFGLIDSDDAGFYARNVSLLVLAPLGGWFVWLKRPPRWATAVIVAVFAASAAVINAYPFDDDGSTFTLAVLHLPVLLSLRLLLGWGLLGSAGSGYECSAGFEVRVVGEAVGFAA